MCSSQYHLYIMKHFSVLEYKGFIRNGSNTDIEIMSLVKLVTL